jgi:RNA polymerase sigma factor (sigma-70 family)
LEESLAKLSDTHKEMIVLRYILGWRVKEIADHLEMKENNVSVTIRRILKRLQEAWSEIE